MSRSPVRSTRLLSALLLGAAATLPAWAQSGPGLRTPHWYAGASVGKPDWQPDTTLGVANGSTGGGGYKLYGGYQITPNFGVELGYAWLGRFTANSTDVKADGPFLDAVGTWPINNQWAVLGRLGVVNARVDSPLGHDRGTDIKGGLGVQYSLSDTTSIRAEWERYGLKAFDETPKVDLYSIGVNMSF